MQIFSYKKRYDFVRYGQISATHCPMTNFYLQLTAKTPTVRKQIRKWAQIVFPGSLLRKIQQWMATNKNNTNWHLPITKPKYIQYMQKHEQVSKPFEDIFQVPCELTPRKNVLKWCFCTICCQKKMHSYFSYFKDKSYHQSLKYKQRMLLNVTDMVCKNNII